MEEGPNEGGTNVKMLPRQDKFAPALPTNAALESLAQRSCNIKGVVLLYLL